MEMLNQVFIFMHQAIYLTPIFIKEQIYIITLKVILMTWIFENCPDEYGSCIRQDVLFALSLIVLLLAIYSCIKVFRQQNKLTFQLLPLSINTLTSLIMVGIYTQMEVFNTRISLLIIELYSYFILTYGFIYMVVTQSNNSEKNMKIIQKIFLIFTTICIIGLISVIVISAFGLVTCDQDQGIGSIVLVALQVPLLFVTYVYSKKSRTILIHLNSKMEISQTEINKQTLLNHDEQLKKVKLLQLKFIRFAFLMTFILHISEVVIYYAGTSNSSLVCSTQTNQIMVSNPLTFCMLTMESISQLFPHFIIPVIFWYLPSRLVKQAVTLYMSNVDQEKWQQQHNALRLKIKRQESKLVNDVQNEQKIRKKMNQNVPKRLERTTTI